MSPMKRSRRLQAGLAGLSVVGALGAALGLGLTTHTQGSQSGRSSADGNAGSGTAQTTSHRGGEGDDDEGGSRQPSQTTQQTSPVTPPSNSAPQATTSGS